MINHQYYNIEIVMSNNFRWSGTVKAVSLEDAQKIAKQLANLYAFLQSLISNRFYSQ